MFSVVIQAGGKSLRMGKNKVLLPVGGLPLIQYVIERFAPVTDDLSIIAQKTEELVNLGHSVYPDAIPERGPLMGLMTGLRHAKNEIVAVLACDMPFASLPLIQHEVHVLTEGNWDVVLPVLEGKAEPLHAVYRRSTCLPAIEADLQQNHSRLIDWHPSVKVCALGRAEINEYDPQGLAFFNVNTPEDVRLVEEIMRSTDQATDE